MSGVVVGHRVGKKTPCTTFLRSPSTLRLLLCQLRTRTLLSISRPSLHPPSRALPTWLFLLPFLPRGRTGVPLASRQVGSCTPRAAPLGPRRAARAAPRRAASGGARRACTGGVPRSARISRLRRGPQTPGKGRVQSALRAERCQRRSPFCAGGIVRRSPLSARPVSRHVTSRRAAPVKRVALLCLPHSLCPSVTRSASAPPSRAPSSGNKQRSALRHSRSHLI